MTKRQAKVAALRVAYKVLQHAIDTGEFADAMEPADADKVERELDLLAQAMFNRWAQMDGRS